MIPCAYLRVYRPLDSFDERERADWERYILSGGYRAARPVYREESIGEGRFGLLSSAGEEHADIRLVDGRYFVCPWQTRLRVLAGILSFRESAPAEIVDAFVPESQARRAARELARLKRRAPSAVPSMLQSPWHVPVRWFVLVEDAERKLVESAGADPFRMYYWTPVRLAIKRAERTAYALRRTDLDPLARPVRELGQWLTAHHHRSMLELDYGSLSGMFAWDELDNDHSARDIQDAIQALSGTGGMARAAELYQTVPTRWAEARGRESLN